MSSMGEFFIARLNEADSIDDIEYIIEQASDNIDDNKEYELIYNTGVAIIQGWIW